MTLQPPYALFVIGDDIDVDYLNNTLTRARKGNFESGWDLWVAITKDWTAAPQKHKFDNQLPEGTQPPISAQDLASSPWTGKTIQECAQWLQGVGPEVGLNKEYFTVMDEFSKKDDTVLACWIDNLAAGGGGGGEGGGEGEGNGLNVKYFPQSTDKIAMEMVTNVSSRFVEKARCYQCNLKDGKPDRSNFGPYP